MEIDLSAFEKRIVAFVLGIVFFGLAFFYVQTRGWLELRQAEKYRIVLERAYGLAKGSRIKMKDLDVGRVESVELTDDNQIVVDLRIKPEFAARLRSDATVTIFSIPFLGSPVVEIDPGHAPTKISSRTLRAEEPKDLVKTFAEFPEKVEPTLERLNRTMDQLDGALASLAEGKGTIGRLLHDETLYREVIRTNAMVQRILNDAYPAVVHLAQAAALLKPTMQESRELIARLQSIQGDVKGLTGEASGALKSARELLEAVQKGDGTVAQMIHNPSLYELSEEALKKTNSLLAKAETAVGKVEKIKAPAIKPVAEMVSTGKGGAVGRAGVEIELGRKLVLRAGVATVQSDNDRTTRPEILWGKQVGKFLGYAGLFEGVPGGRAVYGYKQWQLVGEGRAPVPGLSEPDLVHRVYIQKEMPQNTMIQLGVQNPLDKPQPLVGVGLSTKLK